MVMVLAALSLMTEETKFCGSLTTGQEYRVLLISCGYFVYDFLALVYYGLMDIDMTVHHGTAIAAMFSTVYYGVGSNFWLYGLIVGEISNPFMHGRVMLKHVGLRYSRAYEVLEFIYFGTYTIGRLTGL